MKAESIEMTRNGGYYKYHCNYGHTTGRCLHLAKAISQVANGKNEKLLKPQRVNQELLIERLEKNKNITRDEITKTIFVIKKTEREHMKAVLFSFPKKTWKECRLFIKTH